MGDSGAAVQTGGPDGLPGDESVQAAKAEFQRILSALPAGLLLLPPPPTTSAFEQLKLPLTTRRAQTLRTRPRIPTQSQPTLALEQQQQVLARVRAGESYRAIAPTLGVSYSTIYRLVQASRKRGAL